ncbi:hypothetical protein [Gordonia sputi]|uniref:hypothetical protein n=1 Tax=Gordonia sputi TaxID=36823 RepID=UPI002270FBC3|nr:hypothetical protein [Gordonia sputi]
MTSPSNGDNSNPFYVPSDKSSGIPAPVKAAGKGIKWLLPGVPRWIVWAGICAVVITVFAVGCNPWASTQSADDIQQDRVAQIQAAKSAYQSAKAERGGDAESGSDQRESLLPVARDRALTMLSGGTVAPIMDDQGNANSMDSWKDSLRSDYQAPASDVPAPTSASDTPSPSDPSGEVPEPPAGYTAVNPDSAKPGSVCTPTTATACMWQQSGTHF